MTAGQALRTGLKMAARNPWMVWLFFAANLLLAAAVAAPMHAAITDYLGKSSAGHDLVSGFNAAFLSEFQLLNAGFLKGFSIAIVYAAIVFLVLNTALSAGAFEVFYRGTGATAHAFGRGMGRYAARFLRLAAVASFLYFIVFWFFNHLAAHFVDVPFETGVREVWPFYLNWLRWALFFLCVIAVNALVDYAKADLVADDHASVLAALGHAAGFMLRNLGRVFATYLSLALLSGLAIFAYAAFARFFPQHSPLTIFAWFLVAQAMLWLRWLLRLAQWAAATALYGRVPLPEPVTAPS
ncbi:MAG: hypothetical protein HYX28_04435 [Candidatus Koribacter versatilis]|uniref:Uncharacterized protein n=1 Tax=Candidatus Korobacter versatilis TaxID=658062 RepID=A0A932A792_9BACT|nr:hypothetical protein [Candidatus Koribacter versatilis]